MKIVATLCVACTIGNMVPEAFGQSLADQKLEAEIIKLKVDTQKARLETDNAMFSVIRGASGGSATVAGGEKTTEGLLLSKASLAGSSANVVALLAKTGVSAGADIRPIVIWGSTPPSVAQWLLFKQERERIDQQLSDALRAWANTKSTKMAFIPAAAAVATLVATVIPLFKTDTGIGGGAVTIDESDARASLAAALQQAGYGLFPSLAVTNGAALADTLLAPIAEQRESARHAYEDEYIVFYEGKLKEGGKADAIKLAAMKLKAALDSYKALRDQLQSDSGGVVMASVIDRQRQIQESPERHPILYLLNVDAAYTSTTKKGLFTGIGGKIPAFGSVSTVVDYAIVSPRGEQRGTTACTIRNRPIQETLILEPAGYAARGVTLCDNFRSDGMSKS